jgi:hypothetical protein
LRAHGRRARALLLALLTTACGPKALTLPGGPSTPLADLAPVAQALDHCDNAGTLTAEIGLSGRAAGQRVRGTLHAGFAPADRIRLEAVAPFGGPIFLLAGGGGRATLLLPREDRVLRDADPGAILESIAGLNVAPADLAAWIAGCPGSAKAMDNAASYGAEWIGADLEAAAPSRVWLRRLGGAWRLVATTSGSLTVEFAEHAGVQPGRIRLRRPEGAGAVAIDLGLAVRQVERGIELGDAAFTLDVPNDAVAITLEDLRQSGPLRDRQ